MRNGWRSPVSCFGFLAVQILAVPALAQDTPDDIKQILLDASFGPAPGLAEAYDRVLADQSKDGVAVSRDIAYGSHPLQQLDVYRPAGVTGAPVILFVHGGGYTGGSRNESAERWANIMHYFADHGMVGVNADYRLAPEHPWPAGGTDVRDMVGWITTHIEEHGGDPEQIFAVGFSAGATHVGTYAFDPRYQPGTGHGLAGIVLISGRYTLHWDPDDPSMTGGVTQYFGDDPDRWPSRSITNWVPNSDIPTMIVFSEHDQRNLVATSAELFVEICNARDGRCPRLVQMKYHNHLSQIQSFNTTDDFLGKEILEFIDDGADRQRAALLMR
jgi:acetyl esterase